MAKLIFHPVGNADSTLIHLDDGRLILKDYFKVEATDGDKRVDMEKKLRVYLKSQDRDDIDVTAFSHADDDHCHGAENVFWLDHAEAYQGDDRIPMKEVWVPACFILEKGLSGAAKVIQAEARYRFRKCYGIRVFGNPEQLDDWLKSKGIDPATRTQLITRAGTCVPGFTQSGGGVEIFSHSPFSFRMEDEDVERNDNSLVWHLTFFKGSRQMRCILGADAEHQAWADIVFKTKQRNNEKRLDWDVFKISHHCSYSALSDEKGDEETEPRPEVDDLFAHGSRNCVLISSSDPIPIDDTDQPPHKQTAAYYRRVARDHGSEKNFVVTMEWPSEDEPKPLIVETTIYGFTVRMREAATAGVAAVVSRPSPRFGKPNGD
jgi:hypothetical protein